MKIEHGTKHVRDEYYIIQDGKPTVVGSRWRSNGTEPLEAKQFLKEHKMKIEHGVTTLTAADIELVKGLIQAELAKAAKPGKIKLGVPLESIVLTYDNPAGIPELVTESELRKRKFPSLLVNFETEAPVPVTDGAWEIDHEQTSYINVPDDQLPSATDRFR